MTLTEAAYWTRRLGVFVVAGLAILIIIVYIFATVKPEGPDPVFMQANYACTAKKDEFLDYKLEIPSLELLSGSEKVFQIETPTGKLESLPGVINVFKYSILGQSIDSQGEAKIIAGALGFNPETVSRKGTSEYVWYNQTYGQTLSVRARDLNFTLTTDFKNHKITDTSTLPDKEEAIRIAANVLRSASIMPSDYAKGNQYATYLNIEPNGTLSQAKSKSDAELIRVDFKRKKPVISIQSNWEGAEEVKAEWEQKNFEYEKTTSEVSGKRLDIYNFKATVANLDTQKGNISVLIGPQKSTTERNNLANLYGISYYNWPIEETPCGTYTLISANTALEIIKKGGGSLVYLREKDGDYVVPYTPKRVTKFTIYSVDIGYYDGPDEAKYLQPIYIISGDASLDTGIMASFYYYVPAVNYEAVGDRIIQEIKEVESTNSLGL